MFLIILTKVLCTTSRCPNLVGGVVPRFSFFIAAVDVDTTSVAVEGRIGHRLTCICFNLINLRSVTDKAISEDSNAKQANVMTLWEVS